MKPIVFLFKIFCFLLSAMTISLAVEPEEILQNPKLEEQARIISKDLRCLVCQNQSIDDSNADLAKDLRILVRERLMAGDSNEETIAFITDRYGHYVLLDPPMNLQTLLLWLGPLFILVIGIVTVSMWFRGRMKQQKASDLTTISEKKKPIVKLSKAEEKQLQSILDEGRGER